MIGPSEAPGEGTRFRGVPLAESIVGGDIQSAMLSAAACCAAIGSIHALIVDPKSEVYGAGDVSFEEVWRDLTAASSSCLRHPACPRFARRQERPRRVGQCVCPKQFVMHFPLCGGTGMLILAGTVATWPRIAVTPWLVSAMVLIARFSSDTPLIPPADVATHGARLASKFTGDGAWADWRGPDDGIIQSDMLDDTAGVSESLTCEWIAGPGVSAGPGDAERSCATCSGDGDAAGCMLEVLYTRVMSTGEAASGLGLGVWLRLARMAPPPDMRLRVSVRGVIMRYEDDDEWGAKLPLMPDKAWAPEAPSLTSRKCMADRPGVQAWPASSALQWQGNGQVGARPSASISRQQPASRPSARQRQSDREQASRPSTVIMLWASRKMISGLRGNNRRLLPPPDRVGPLCSLLGGLRRTTLSRGRHWL